MSGGLNSMMTQCFSPSPKWAGLSHLGEYREKEHVVPSGLFDFSSDGSLVWVGSQEVESDLSQQGDVLRPVVFAISGTVLVEDDVEHPVELVLDGPMGSHDMEQLAGRHGPGKQEVSRVDLVGLALDPAHGIDPCDGANAREVVGLGQGGVGNDLGRALVHATVAGFDLGTEGVDLVGGDGKPTFDRREQAALVLLEGHD